MKTMRVSIIDEQCVIKYLILIGNILPTPLTLHH